VIVMSDELDPGLRRLFASTAEHPADEAFVSAVSARTSGERLIAGIARTLAQGLLFGAGAGALAMILGLVLDQSAKVITPLLTASPVGWAAGVGLALAGVVCFRLLAPFAPRRF
jgi:hypothetical protein